MSDISMAPRRSFQNRSAILSAYQCSCYFCLRTFFADKVKDYTDDGETAKCPHCDMDSVLPRRYPLRVLRAMHERWFTKISQPVSET